MWNRRHRWLRRLAVGFAFAGLVVPTAANADPIDFAKDGVNALPSVEYKIRFFDRGDYVSQPSGATVAVRRPDDRAVRISPQPVESTVVRPDDRAVRISPQPVESTVVRPDDRSVRFAPSGGELPQVVAAPSTGFDWGDAGIGAATVLGLMLLALGAALATRHANRKALAGA